MQSNRLAVVTGGGRGIGRAIALRLARDGIRVAVWARSADEIETVAREIRDAGGSAYAIQADVSDWSSVEDAVDRTREVAGRVESPYAMPFETRWPIHVCRGPKAPLSDAWRQGKTFI